MSQPLHRQLTIVTALCLALTACVVIPIRATDLGPTRSWPASATCPTPARSAANAPRLVALMNAERSKAHLAPLTLSPALSGVSHAYACELAARGDINHRGTDGSSVTERLRRGGISASTVAENTASGQRSPEAVMAGWMASPHHRANILRPNVSRVGLGQADGAQPVWVTDFAS